MEQCSREIRTETVIAWGRFEQSDETIRSLLKDYGITADNAFLHSEKERWKEILIDAGLYSLVKKRLDRLFRSLSESSESLHPKAPVGRKDCSIDDFLDRWLIRPHAGTYQARFEHATDQERLIMKDRTLKELSLHTHHPGAERTFYQLTIFHEAIDEGIAHWYRHTMTKPRFTSEDMQFLHFLSDRAPRTAVKLILQTVDIQSEVQKPNIRTTIPPLLKRLFLCVNSDEATRLLTLYRSRYANRKAMLELIP